MISKLTVWGLGVAQGVCAVNGNLGATIALGCVVSAVLIWSEKK